MSSVSWPDPTDTASKGSLAYQSSKGYRGTYEQGERLKPTLLKERRKIVCTARTLFDSRRIVFHNLFFNKGLLFTTKLRELLMLSCVDY